jgi:hypothetical protein
LRSVVHRDAATSPPSATQVHFQERSIPIILRASQYKYIKQDLAITIYLCLICFSVARRVPGDAVGHPRSRRRDGPAAMRRAAWPPRAQPDVAEERRRNRGGRTADPHRRRRQPHDLGRPPARRRTLPVCGAQPGGHQGNPGGHADRPR